MKLKIYELFGVFFTLIFGVFLHFTYEWSGRNPFVALFSAVNESTWEHLKLLFVPYLSYSFFELKILHDKYSNLITAKCIGMLAGMILIPLLFYIYKYFMARDYLILDIMIFIISVIVAYMVDYYIMVLKFPSYNKMCFILCFLILLIFGWFTINPPEYSLFFDPVKKSYGI